MNKSKKALQRWLFKGVVALLLLAQAAPVQAAQVAMPLMPQTTPTDEAAVDSPTVGDPDDCIDPLKAAHISATIASLLPIPGFSDGADIAEYLTNLALKDCTPVVTPPVDRVIDPATQSSFDSDPCTYRVLLPLSEEDKELIILDRQVIEAVIAEIEADSRLKVSSAYMAALRHFLTLRYGRFETQKLGEFQDIYGIVFSSSSHGTNWGGLGTPSIYHYNSDVRIQATHSGQRMDDETIQFRPGAHTVTWRGDTLISFLDFIPPVPGPFDNPVGEKVAKQTGQKSFREALRKAAREAIEKGNKEFAKKVAKETAKAFVEEVAEEVAKEVFEEVVTEMLNSYFSLNKTRGVYAIDSQQLYMLDRNAPVIQGAQDIVVEALEPGGVSSGKTIAGEQAKLIVTDDCDLDPTLRYSTPSFWPLNVDENGNPLPSAEIVWIAEDNGAATPTGGRNETQVTRMVTVVDTKPPILVAPPPVIMEGTGAVDVSLGWPQVFDVADLRPTISNDAPAEFTPGVYRIQWRATDASRNVSAVTDDTEQIVNIKAPGTNVLPTAFDQTGANAVSAIADEPTRIVVRGQDGNNPPDPLWFSIENQPENGFFIAPLYPYFIQDYRMSARYSPSIAAQLGEDRAWEIASVPGAMSNFMKALCSQTETPDPSIPVTPPDELPHDFVSWGGGGERYMAVDDDGFTYIYDFRYTKCNVNHQPDTTERLSVWDPDGNFYGELILGDKRLSDVNFDLARGQIIMISYNGTISSASADTFVSLFQINKGNAAEPITQLVSYKMSYDVIDPETGKRPSIRAESAAVDSNGLIYAVGRQNSEGMIVAKPNAEEPELLDYIGYPIYHLNNVLDEPGQLRLTNVYDIAIDSENHIYVTARHETVIDDGTNRRRYSNRIYKFAPAQVETDGSIAPGELMGWLGRCDDGPNCDYIAGHSIGFTCTDETCFIDEADTNGNGDRPGQFDNARNLVIDPNDVIYVADSGNARVQRFTSDGLFAGEARSTGDGSSFVLGDFGSPNNISVNKNSFFILDGSREIVHVFDAAVIHGIDDTSAWVEYQSDSNYVGQDRFTFSATDGFRTGDGDLLSSPPATVEVNVARNFRPPDAADNLMIVTPEDTAVPVTLAGYDLDGDSLTFEVTVPPTYGELSGTPPTLIYTPAPNFFGEDSFDFVAIDDSGHPDNRSTPETVGLFVESRNDTPLITFDPATLRTGIGYPLTLDAGLFDPDPDEAHTVVVNWGDGTVENTGEVRNDGTLSGPVIVEDENGKQQVRGYHTYTSGGTFTIEVCVTDSAATTGCAQKLAVVEAMADLAIERTGPYFLGAGANQLEYTLTASNLVPPTGGGVTAEGVTITETLTDGLRYAGSASGNGCAVAGNQLTCIVGTLAPGEQRDFPVRAVFDTTTRAGDLFGNQVEVSQNGADPIPENNTLAYDLTIVHAADFIVDSYGDQTDLAPGDGVCATFAETCTLRAAVMESNALAGRQSIALGYGVYLLNPPATGNVVAVEPQQEDNSVSGDLDINDDVVILGLSADNTVIHGNGKDRVIQVHPNGRLQLEDTLLTGGSPLHAFEGGGLLNSGGQVTLARVSIIGNAAINGGGIANNPGSILVRESTIMGNVASGSGGGVSNQAELELRNVTVSGNRAQSGGALASGLGIARLENVTMTDNSASSSGGGISSPGETVVAVNTIIAGNDAPLGPACGAAFRSQGNNLIDKLDDCSVLGETGSNIIGEAAELDNLTLNAANTFSQTPLDDSRVIDRGSCRVEIDQRGMVRPFGSGCDIGAVEFGADDVPERLTYRTFLPLVVRK